MLFVKTNKKQQKRNQIKTHSRIVPSLLVIIKSHQLHILEEETTSIQKVQKHWEGHPSPLNMYLLLGQPISRDLRLSFHHYR